MCYANEKHHINPERISILTKRCKFHQKNHRSTNWGSTGLKKLTRKSPPVHTTSSVQGLTHSRKFVVNAQILSYILRTEDPSRFIWLLKKVSGKKTDNGLYNAHTKHAKSCNTAETSCSQMLSHRNTGGLNLSAFFCQRRVWLLTDSN